MEYVKKDDIQVVQELALELREGNKNIVVMDDIGCQKAGEYAAQLRSLVKSVEEYFSPLKSQAHNLHKDLVSREKNETKPLNTEIIRVKGLIGTYLNEKERKLQEARAKAEAERRAKEEEIRKEAEKIEDEKKRLEKESEIETIREDIPLPQATPNVKLEVGKMSSSMSYEFRIKDNHLLLSALLGGTLPIDCISISLRVGELKKLAKDDGLDMIRKSGIAVNEVRNVRVGL